MTKDETISKLCAVTSLVADELFQWSRTADCFCVCANSPSASVSVDSGVVEYIERAVREAIARDRALIKRMHESGVDAELARDAVLLLTTR